MSRPILIPSNLVFDVQEPRPILDLPADCKARLRLRPERLAEAYLRFPDRTERRLLFNEAAGWRLGTLSAVNFTVSSSSVPAPAAPSDLRRSAFDVGRSTFSPSLSPSQIPKS